MRGLCGRILVGDLPERGIRIASSQPAIKPERATGPRKKDHQQTGHKRLVRGGGRRSAPLGQIEVECHEDSPQRSRTSDGDRKSTRLNSSHHSISYAVVCLKKKKKGRDGKDADNEGRTKIGLESNRRKG